MSVGDGVKKLDNQNNALKHFLSHGTHRNKIITVQITRTIGYLGNWIYKFKAGGAGAPATKITMRCLSGPVDQNHGTAATHHSKMGKKL